MGYAWLVNDFSQIRPFSLIFSKGWTKGQALETATHAQAGSALREPSKSTFLIEGVFSWPALSYWIASNTKLQKYLQICAEANDQNVAQE